MGNPKGVTTGPVDAAGQVNGILASVPGEYVGAGTLSLPPAELHRGETASAVVDAGWAGRVRLTYRSRQIKHRRNSRWAWLAERADREPPP